MNTCVCCLNCEVIDERQSSRLVCVLDELVRSVNPFESCTEFVEYYDMTSQAVAHEV